MTAACDVMPASIALAAWEVGRSWSLTLGTYFKYWNIFQFFKFYKVMNSSRGRNIICSPAYSCVIMPKTVQIHSSPSPSHSLPLSPPHPPPPPPSTPEPISRPLTPIGHWQLLENSDISNSTVQSEVMTPANNPQASYTLRSKITLSIRSKIRCLRAVALWPFRSIAQEFKLPVSTVFSICTQPNTPQAVRIGQPRSLSLAQQEQLIHQVTATQANRRKSFFAIAEEIGIHVHERTLRRFFTSRSYHRRIARVKPFLTEKAKLTRLEFAQTYLDWTTADWRKVIWTDECAFNVGGFAGNTWVTRMAGEEYLEDCLLP